LQYKAKPIRQERLTIKSQGLK